MWDALFINPNLQSLKQEKLWDCDLDLILRNVSAFCIKFRESSRKLSEKLLACFDAVFNENASNNSSDRGWLLPMPLMLSAMVHDLPREPRWSPHSWPQRGDTPDWVLMSRNYKITTWVSKILAKDFPEWIIWNSELWMISAAMMILSSASRGRRGRDSPPGTPSLPRVLIHYSRGSLFPDHKCSSK